MTWLKPSWSKNTGTSPGASRTATASPRKNVGAIDFVPIPVHQSQRNGLNGLRFWNAWIVAVNVSPVHQRPPAPAWLVLKI